MVIKIDMYIMTKLNTFLAPLYSYFESRITIHIVHITAIDIIIIPNNKRLVYVFIIKTCMILNLATSLNCSILNITILLYIYSK